VNFLHLYAKRYPNVQVKLIDIVGPKMLEMLEQGAIDLGQMVSRGILPDDPRFGSHLVGSLDILAASHPKLALGPPGIVEVGQLAPYPLLLHEADYTLRRAFEAACRLAGVNPNVQFEARDPRTLLAMAEADHGVAIITSALRTRDYAVHISTVTYRGKALREPVTILWNRRRPRPRYAAAFCEMLAEYVRQIFPVTRPTGLKSSYATKSRKLRATP
jgi:DNA-binding transcriptional LysR family regulator